jgi:hypothetical protein
MNDEEILQYIRTGKLPCGHHPKSKEVVYICEVDGSEHVLDIDRAKELRHGNQ